MTKYRSKIGPVLVIPIAIIMGGTIASFAYERLWAGLLLVLLLVGFIAHLFLTTYYMVHDTTLNIRSGFLINETIEISLIKEIKETNSLISAPAISLDRLAILYNKYDTVIISPKYKAAFINHLVSLNPSIKVPGTSVG